MLDLKKLRNIGISAHIDSGKTTLSERILYYTGKIHRMAEVRGNDGAPTLDYTELEAQKGITINSAATCCHWQGHQINLIDTPGHVDFTIEVERALRVLDGAILVLCAVAGVQPQSVTVDRQMKRYRVPRLAFINKMDRPGANPFKVTTDLREKLHLNPVLVQYPIGSEDQFIGVIDLITMQAHYFEGEDGRDWFQADIPAQLQEAAAEAREKLLDQLSLLSDELMAVLLDDQEPDPELLWSVLRQATLKREVVPVLMGSAYKNKGVQTLLDAVVRCLPSPIEREAVQATDVTTDAEVALAPDPNASLVALAFKLTEDEFGQLTYLRLYAGTLNPGDRLLNSRTGQRVRISRLVRMHADEREELTQAVGGDIVAALGLDCASGDTLCGEGLNLALENMFVPEPVITLAIAPRSQADSAPIAKALHRFDREDPTFRVSTDSESGQTLISGMGELHLEIYLERLRREYKAQVDVGQPAVAYREAITQRASFDYRFKKQSGGPGSFAHVKGWLEPCEEPFMFANQVVGGVIPAQFISSCEKGFRDAITSGSLEGYPVVGVKVVLNGGDHHPVDSKDTAFRFAAKQAFDQAFSAAQPHLLEPVMAVSVETPGDRVGAIQGDLLSRRGLVLGSEVLPDCTVLKAEVPLVKMFGYSTVLRSLASGMATFSMELAGYRPVSITSQVVGWR
ncbi:MAG: elongation factor G [Spirulina sp. SIO3F2]|nr:elongation factor G [Spirulina sp. SIO3F2]